MSSTYCIAMEQYEEFHINPSGRLVLLEPPINREVLFLLEAPTEEGPITVILREFRQLAARKGLRMTIRPDAAFRQWRDSLRLYRVYFLDANTAYQLYPHNRDLEDYSPPRTSPITYCRTDKQEVEDVPVQCRL